MVGGHCTGEAFASVNSFSFFLFLFYVTPEVVTICLLQMANVVFQKLAFEHIGQELVIGF